MSLIGVDFYELKDDWVSRLVWHTTKPLFRKEPYEISHCNLILDTAGTHWTVMTANKFPAKMINRDKFHEHYNIEPTYTHTFGETNLNRFQLKRLIAGYQGGIIATALWRLSGYYLGHKPKLCTTLAQEILRSSGYMVKYNHKPIDFYKEVKNENYYVLGQSKGWQDPCCESDCKARLCGWSEASISAFRKAYQR